MWGMKSPIEDAYHVAVSNRLFSIVYMALNEGVRKNRKSFRNTWIEHGGLFLGELLLRCAGENWNSYPETFWLNPWLAGHLRRYEAGNLCAILEQWLADRPLPTGVNEDPHIEDEKVQKLADDSRL